MLNRWLWANIIIINLLNLAALLKSARHLLLDRYKYKSNHSILRICVLVVRLVMYRFVANVLVLGVLYFV